MSDIIRAHARLIILKHLATQSGYSSNSAMLETELATFGIVKPRDWLHVELEWLRDAAGAVDVTAAGTVRTARLTPKGLEHVEYRQVIPGIARPSPEQ